MKNTIAKEVKEEILAKVKAGEPVSALSKQYGVSDKAIYNWLKRQAGNRVSWMEHIRLKKENQQLKEIIGILTLEVEKSKKREVSEVIKLKAKDIPRKLISSILGVLRRNFYNQNTKQKEADLILKEQILKVLELNPSCGHRGGLQLSLVVAKTGLGGL